MYSHAALVNLRGTGSEVASRGRETRRCGRMRQRSVVPIVAAEDDGVGKRALRQSRVVSIQALKS
jgi:hypothetical protein